jgi:hypothetical protein
MEKPKKINARARADARSAINELIRHSPLPKTPAPPIDDMATSRAIGGAAVQQLRELACRRTGLTMEQLLEAEKAIVWPREIIPVTPSPRMLARRRMAEAHVPELFIACVGDKEPLACDPLTKVRDFLDGTSAFLVLSAAKGTMKTGSACWALGQVDDGAFIEAQDVVQESIEKTTRWQHALAASLLVFDDLGTEKCRTDGEIAQFYDSFYRLFNGVYTGRRRMIITCNLTIEQFKREPEQGGYGTRLYDRFRECGKWWNVGGESVRGQQSEMPLERVPGEDG